MFKQILEDIQLISLKRMETPVVYLQPFSKAYIPVPLCEENFISITSKNTNEIITFIDGGNTEILKTPDYSLQFLRFAAISFKNGIRVSQKIKEGYILISAQNEIVTQSYNLDMQFPSFTLDNPLLKNSDTRTKLNTVANMFRSVYEIHFAKEIQGIIVLDHSLIPANCIEEKALEELYEINTEIIGLNKTTALLCNNGESIISALQNFEKKGMWCYYPLFSTQEHAVLSFVKLHPLSKHVFRLEVHTSKTDHIKEYASILTSISNDGAFIGYPYGLIIADQLARVSNKEKETLQTLFFHQAGKEFNTALNAHDILDRMQ
ncbi:MAG: hypothetical protein WC254_03255 [Candidatus Woesearchaeota archaeon]|jgi:hypothetical protein